MVRLMSNSRRPEADYDDVQLNSNDKIYHTIVNKTYLSTLGVLKAFFTEPGAGVARASSICCCSNLSNSSSSCTGASASSSLESLCTTASSDMNWSDLIFCKCIWMRIFSNQYIFFCKSIQLLLLYNKFYYESIIKIKRKKLEIHHTLIVTKKLAINYLNLNLNLIVYDRGSEPGGNYPMGLKLLLFYRT